MSNHIANSITDENQGSPIRKKTSSDIYKIPGAQRTIPPRTPLSSRTGSSIQTTPSNIITPSSVHYFASQTPSKWTEYDNVPVKGNPFDEHLTYRLQNPIWCPHTFDKPNTPGSAEKTPKTFRWSIDQMAIMKPADINEKPFKQVLLSSSYDKVKEEQHQAMIDEFFENQICIQTPTIRSVARSQFSIFKVPLTPKDDSLTPKRQLKKINEELSFDDDVEMNGLRRKLFNKAPVTTTQEGDNEATPTIAAKIDNHKCLLSSSSPITKNMFRPIQTRSRSPEYHDEVYDRLFHSGSPARQSDDCGGYVIMGGGASPSLSPIFLSNGVMDESLAPPSFSPLNSLSLSPIPHQHPRSWGHSMTPDLSPIAGVKMMCEGENDADYEESLRLKGLSDFHLRRSLFIDLERISENQEKTTSSNDLQLTAVDSQNTMTSTGPQGHDTGFDSAGSSLLLNSDQNGSKTNLTTQFADMPLDDSAIENDESVSAGAIYSPLHKLVKRQRLDDESQMSGTKITQSSTIYKSSLLAKELIRRAKVETE